MCGLFPSFLLSSVPMDDKQPPTGDLPSLEAMCMAVKD